MSDMATLCTVRTVLDLPGIPSHEATIALPESQPGRWVRRFAALRDSTGKHSLGIHVYSKLWETRGKPILEIAVRWNNGLVNRNGTGFCGRVYFDSLGIQPTTPGYYIHADPRAGSSYEPATRTLFVASGGGHVFPPRGVLERRYLIVPADADPSFVSKVRDNSLGFKAVVFDTTPWGPAQEAQPQVNRGHYGNVFRGAANQAMSLLASGQRGTVYAGPNGTWAQLTLMNGALGPFIPDGDRQPGAPAGYEIDIAYGWGQCPETLVMSSIAHECSMARNTVAWFDLATGDQITIDSWSSSEAGRPQNMATGQLELPVFCKPGQNYANMNQGSSPYQATLEGYADDDLEHAIRASDDAFALAGSAGDAMAQDDIAMLFEHHRAFTFNDRADARPRPDGSVSWNGYNSLTRDLSRYQAKQHKGDGRFLRWWGWMLHLAVFRQNPQFCAKMVDAYLLAVDGCGIVQREPHYSGNPADPWIPPGYLGTQHFHNAIDQIAALRAVRYLKDARRTNALLQALHVWRQKVIENPDCTWAGAPAKWIYRQRSDGSEIDPITKNDRSPYGMREHVLGVLGLAALTELSAGNAAGAKQFLNAGLKIDVPHPDLLTRLAWIRSLPADQSQYASYAAAIEAL